MNLSDGEAAHRPGGSLEPGLSRLFNNARGVPWAVSGHGVASGKGTNTPGKIGDTK